MNLTQHVYGTHEMRVCVCVCVCTMCGSLYVNAGTYSTRYGQWAVSCRMRIHQNRQPARVRLRVYVCVCVRMRYVKIFWQNEREIAHAAWLAFGHASGACIAIERNASRSSSPNVWTAICAVLIKKTRTGLIRPGRCRWRSKRNVMANLCIVLYTVYWTYSVRCNSEILAWGTNRNDLKWKHLYWRFNEFSDGNDPRLFAGGIL